MLIDTAGRIDKFQKRYNEKNFRRNEKKPPNIGGLFYF
jgi:hypothetical protein